MNYQAHETAIVDNGADIGAGTKIWHFSHICSGAVIGQNCSLGQNVYVGGAAAVGSDVKIQNNVSIFDGVVLGDNVFCGPSVVFTNVNNPRSLYPQRGNYSSTFVGEGATIGANATVICGHKIGKYAFIGAGSVVAGDVPNYALVVGVPARQIGWMSEAGERLEMPLSGNGMAECSVSGLNYELIDGVISSPKE